MATIYWRGRSAYINWSDERGQHRISLGAVTPREAEAARLAKEYELSGGRRLIDFGKVQTFDKFAEGYADWFDVEFPASAYRVRKIIEEVLMPEFGYRSLNDISPALVEQWKMRRSQEKSRRSKTAPTRLKAASVNKELRQLKAILSKAVEWEVIKDHPCAKVKKLKELDSKPPRWYSIEELRVLYAATEAHRYWWQLFANTGLRKAEALHLRRKDIKGDRLHILSATEARTKSGKWREVPLVDAAGEALEKLPGEDYVFPRLHSNSFTRAFLRDATAAELDGSLHCLRHTFCSHLVMRGVPLRAVQAYAGHANYSTTEKYAHLIPDKGLDPLRGLSLA